ncbi:NUDIX hydrolase [Marinoscillum furvescens]|uniref:8-oxo-dGTP pyrophosphatase MutT (NUDIX family) n=1 Tax=Marinoscillum furvescens DSM 4134 TaxID=1122208 RepID=A0A3D9KYR6_MARFU|nr:CoA pyrophosphatase [Marinoscillum furvescens]RED93839.1 8-oxo-dGTP pyrophosphatase MutT (NUDIX family) [Marinoscillum furvescens DSM 4134]
MMEELIPKLKARLKSGLPGDVAHQKMTPRLINGNRVRMKNSQTPRKGAVLVLLYQDADRWHFPLIQRPSYEGVHSGQMALPGGRMEPEDQNLIDTALRETHEEIGVPAANVEVLGQLSEFMVTASNHLVLPVVGYSPHKPSFTPDPREVAEVIRAPLDQLLNKDHLKEKEIEASGGFRLHSPYFELNDKVVWGATAMMLSEFVHILEDLT